MLNWEQWQDSVSGRDYYRAVENGREYRASAYQQGSATGFEGEVLDVATGVPLKCSARRLLVRGTTEKPYQSIVEAQAWCQQEADTLVNG